MEQADRELIEQAAIAAEFGFDEKSGKCQFIWTESEYPRRSKQGGALWNYVGWGDDAELWNPLTDDGDAFRLAAKLKLDIRHIPSNSGDGHVMVSAPQRELSMVGGFGFLTGAVPYAGDVNAATRRAIVLVAVKIAKEGKDG